MTAPVAEDAWHWVDFACADAEARDQLLALLDGSDLTGSEEHDTTDGLRVRVYWPGSVAGDRVQAACAAAELPPAIRRLDRGLQGREDWLAEWKRHFTPVRVSPHVWVCPPWEVCRPGEGEHVVVIAPRMAFGTGHHATTQLCIELLEACLCPGDTVVDVGTGSGIVAIVAAKLGAAHVYAVETDPVACANARENVLANAVQERITVIEAPFAAGCVPSGADLTVANIVTAGLLPVLPAIAACAPSGQWIVSGIGLEHEDLVLAALRDLGRQPARRGARDGWCAFACPAGDRTERAGAARSAQ